MNPYLYDFDLYLSPDETIPASQLTGGNAKGLLVVVNESDYSEGNATFLSKVLKAVNYDIAQDAQLLKLPKDQFYDVSKLISKEEFQHIMIFNVKPKDIGLSIESYLYAPFQISDKIFLIGHALEKIKSATEYKKNLWTAMQHIFQV